MSELLLVMEVLPEVLVLREALPTNVAVAFGVAFTRIAQYKGGGGDPGGK